jgi:hypothetical protein
MVLPDADRAYCGTALEENGAAMTSQANIPDELWRFRFFAQYSTNRACGQVNAYNSKRPV